MKIKTDIGNTGNMDRDHINVLIKAKDEIIDYRGEPLTINPGVVQLYKLITQSYQEFFPLRPIKIKVFGKDLLSLTISSLNQILENILSLLRHVLLVVI